MIDRQDKRKFLEEVVTADTAILITSPAEGGHWNHYIKVTTGGHNSSRVPGKKPWCHSESVANHQRTKIIEKPTGCVTHAKNKIKAISYNLTVAVRIDTNTK